MLKSLLNLIVFVLLAAAAVIGLFVAWWIAVFALLGIGAWLLVRRFLGKPLKPAGDVVIEGEYEVEPESGRKPARPRVVINSSRVDEAP